MYDFRAVEVSTLRQLTAAERTALAPYPVTARRLIETGRIRCDRCPAAAQLTCHSLADTAAVLYRFEVRIRLLHDYASERADREPTAVLPAAVEQLLEDWQRCRHELVAAVRESACRGYIQDLADCGGDK